MIEEEKKSNVKIMIVDDVRVNLRLLGSIIESMGHTVISFQSALSAIGALKEEMPSLILLDAMMPDMDGFEFCQTIKKDVRTRDIPVIFISASVDEDDKKKAFEAGAVDYITKPFQRLEIIARAKIHIKMYEMQQKLTQYNLSLNKLVMEQNHKIEEEKKTLLYALAKVAEGKDSLTANHIPNVQYNSRILAQSLQFSPKFEKEVFDWFIEIIGVASTLHDIGKISIPDTILLKSEKLTDEEVQITRGHSKMGAEFLRSVADETSENEFLKMAIEIAEFHHENWDGSGYPLGLKGEEIPLSARIVHIIDVYDTLHADRSYRKALSDEECNRIMAEGSGKDFDPYIMEVFSKISAQLKTL